MEPQLAVQIQPPAVYIKNTGTPKGRGVFAARAFKLGEVVEACPIVTFDPLPDRRLPTDIKRIVFGWGKMIGSQRRMPAIALGYGSLYNHSNPATMKCEADPANDILRFVAIRDVEADEELTINYNSIASGQSDNDIWFEKNNVTLIES